jgi:hypothetical protein
MEEAIPSSKLTVVTRLKKDFQIRMRSKARRRWLMPVIIAIQEAENRRISIRSQPRQVV